MVARQQPPSDAVPVRTGTAEADAGQERAEPTNRQGRLARRVAQRHGFELGVLEQLLAHRIFEVVAHAWEREVLARRPVRPAFETNHLEARLGELAGQNAAGETDPDADGIDFLENDGHGARSFY